MKGRGEACCSRFPCVCVGKARAVKGFPLVVKLVKQDVLHTGERERGRERKRPLYSSALFLLLPTLPSLLSLSGSHLGSRGWITQKRSALDIFIYFRWKLCIQSSTCTVLLRHTLKNSHSSFYSIIPCNLSLPLAQSHAYGRNTYSLANKAALHSEDFIRYTHLKVSPFRENITSLKKKKQSF